MAVGVSVNYNAKNPVILFIFYLPTGPLDMGLAWALHIRYLLGLDFRLLRD